jgi:DNA-binding GntR family transcriptional regulator
MDNAVGIRQRRGVPKYKLIKRYLIEEIRKMKPGENRLETEDVLSGKMGVSKATIRQAMDELISEDLITRQQGKGVFGHPRVSKLSMYLGGNANFREFLSRAGYRVSVTQSRSSRGKASEKMVRRAPEYAGKEVYRFDWTYYANDKPAILCRVEVPMELVLHPFESEVPPLTLKDSLKMVSEKEFSYAISWLRGSVDPAAAAILGVEPSTAFLVWDENFFDLYDYHLCYNEILFHPGMLDFSVICHF